MTNPEIPLQPKPDSRRAQRARYRASQRTYISNLAERFDVSLRQLAIKAEVGPTTISRFMNDPDYEGLLSADILGRLGHAYGVRWELPEGTEEETDASARAEEILRRMLASDRAQHHFVRDELMAGRGICAGDIVASEPRPPKSGEIVVAKARRSGGPIIEVVRLYLPPHLVACPHGGEHDDDKLRPLVVDTVDVRIAGVVTGLLRSVEEDSILYD